MNHALYTLARHSLYLANRLYAQWSFCVNYALYTFLYLFLRGIPPTTSTRPSPGKAWHPAVFISDAHSPVGKATAILLAQSGYVVFAGVPTLAEGTSLVNAFTSSNTSHLRTRGGTIHSLLCISTDPVSIRAVATTVAQSLDATNPQRTKLVAIVCLAHLEQIAPLEHTSDTSISDSITHNLLPHITITRAFLPLLRHSTTSTTQSRILLLTSFISYTPLPGQSLSSATSASIDSFSRALTAELYTSKDNNDNSNSNIRCTVIRYGSITTTAAAMQIAYETYRSDPSSCGFQSSSSGHAQAITSSPLPSASTSTSLPTSVPTTTSTTKHHHHDPHRPSYARMMRTWSRILYYQTQLGSPPIHVAKQVKDALTDAYLQPCYTVGWDALLAQALRDFIPEPIYEWLLFKIFS